MRTALEHIRDNFVCPTVGGCGELDMEHKCVHCIAKDALGPEVGSIWRVKGVDVLFRVQERGEERVPVAWRVGKRDWHTDGATESPSSFTDGTLERVS